MKAVTLLIRGKLYRTGFRFYTVEKAVQSGIKGFVKYTAAHDILIHAEGEPEQIESFLKWCRSGYPSCRVYDIEITDCDVEGHTTFEMIEEPDALPVSSKAAK